MEKKKLTDVSKIYSDNGESITAWFSISGTSVETSTMLTKLQLEFEKYTLVPFINRQVNFTQEEVPAHTDKIHSFIQDVFANYDNEMKMFLGYHADKSATPEDQAEQHYKYLLSKEQDGKHKYFFITVNSEDGIRAAGIVYIYEFNEKWQRCAIGIGLLPQYRHQGIASTVILDMVKELLHKGIVRVECAVECDNASSLNLCNRMRDRYNNVYYEGLRKNAWGNGIDAHIYSFINSAS